MSIAKIMDSFKTHMCLSANERRQPHCFRFRPSVTLEITSNETLFLHFPNKLLKSQAERYTNKPTHVYFWNEVPKYECKMLNKQISGAVAFIDN